MKKLILSLTLLFVGISANAQYTPSNNLNYVKLLKVPPVGSVEDSVLVYDGSDSFMKMRPSSELITKATPTKSGVVKTDILEADPIVYTKTTLDNSLKLKEYLSTGLLKNGLITINADPTKINISAGIGVISNFDDPENPVSEIISFPAFTGVTPTYLNTGNITYVAIAKTPSIQVFMQATPFTSIQRRDLIILGAAVHSNLTNINVVNNISAPSNSTGNQLHDFIEAVGALNITGNKYTANGANLSLNKSAGTIFKFGVNFATNWKEPHQLAQSAGTVLTFRYRTQNGTEGSDVTVINPAVYDLSNVLTAVPNNKFTIQTVVMFQTGLTRILYGQTVYDDLATAKNAIFTRNFNIELNSKENGIIRAYIIVKNNTTSLLNATDSEIIEAQKFGGVASGGVALTLANIVTALGYTPENVANKQNSLMVDGIGVKYPTVDAVNKALTYVTPEQFGAVGDGVTNDAVAIQSAINSGKMVLLGAKTYLVNSSITISSSTRITGSGSLSILTTNSNLPILILSASNVKLDNFKLQGSGRGSAGNYASDSPLQDGVYLTGYFTDNNVSHMYFEQLGGSGVRGVKNVITGNPAIVTACDIDNSFFINNLNGVFFEEESEFHRLSNNFFRDNQYGVRMIGGNNAISDGHVFRNRTGISIEAGVNDAHSIVNAVNVNQNLDFGVKIDGILNGHTFSNCLIAFNGISVVNSTDVTFDGGQYKLDTPFIFTNTTNLTLKNVSFLANPVVTSSGNVALRYFNNSYPDGVSVPANMVESIVNLRNVDIFDVNGTTSAKNLIRMRFNLSNRFLFGSDSGITGGNDADLNAYVYGNNSMFLSTNGVKRLTISGAGASTFSGSVGLTGATASTIALFDASKNIVSASTGTYPSLAELAYVKGATSSIQTQINAKANNVLTGYISGAGTVSGTDTVLQAIQKLNGNDALNSSGTYTPTITGISNVTSGTSGTSTYSKVGNIVTVSVTFSVTATNLSTLTTFEIQLPISTTTATGSHVGNGTIVSGITNIPVSCTLTGLTKISCVYYSASTSNTSGGLIFQYSI